MSGTHRVYGATRAYQHLSRAATAGRIPNTLRLFWRLMQYLSCTDLRLLLAAYSVLTCSCSNRAGLGFLIAH
eukprot:2199330-Rhodomonas_salina.3